jgi:hypothetical protein
MTTNSPHQPNQLPQQNGYNPITLDDVQMPPSSRTDFLFAELSSPLLRWVAAPLLGFLFILSLRTPEVGALTVLVLFGSVFVRLDPKTRQIATVPLTLATIKLASVMATQFHVLSMRTKPGDLAVDQGFGWLPVFFSVCLVYLPKRESVTLKMILTSSCLLLAAGLLPGLGFVVIFSLLSYTLFFVITVGIVADFCSHARGQGQTNPQPAH